jgi:hypothetical protein
LSQIHHSRHSRQTAPNVDRFLTTLIRSFQIRPIMLPLFLAAAADTYPTSTRTWVTPTPTSTWPTPTDLWESFYPTAWPSPTAAPPSLSAGAIAGIAAGAVLAAFLAVGAVWLALRRRQAPAKKYAVDDERLTSSQLYG